MDTTIARVTATPVSVPMDFRWAGSDHVRHSPICVVTVETKGGVIGHGVTALSPAPVVAAAVEHVGAPAVIGLDAMAHEHVWNVLDWALTAPGQTGIGCNALSAIDIALWDIKGKVLDQPVWKLLGGARRTLPAYATCGFSWFDRDQLVAAAKHMTTTQGCRSIKIQVGRPGLDPRAEMKPLDQVVAEDLCRIEALREALGDDIEIAMDAGARLDLAHAVKLCDGAAAYDVGFFEEPLVENDIENMARLRARTTIPLACGQSEGRIARFRELIAAEAIDIVQPNVIVGGGFTGAARTAALAVANGLPVFHGGGASFHNAHLQAGLASGSGIEWQMASVPVMEKLMEGTPRFADGALTMTDAPGLGFAPRADALAEFRMT